MNTFKWLLKREFWEHKGGFFWLPIVVGAIMTAITAVLLGFALLGLKGGIKINSVDASSLVDVVSVEQKAAFAARVVAGYAGLMVPMLFAFSICVFFFCLNTLYDERKDRSVLFWKSLPISDASTVLSKVVMALAVAPLITLVVASLTAVVAGFLICTAAAVGGLNIFGEVLGSPDTYLVPLQMAAVLPIYALWALPTIGWLLLVSAWARSKPLLWAIGVPLMTGTLLSWINGMFQFGWNMGWFWKNIIGRLLLSVLPGTWLGERSPALAIGEAMRTSSGMSEILSQSWQMLAAPGIWIGVAIGAAMIYAAIRLRGWRDEG